jgi:hypothetical protein
MIKELNQQQPHLHQHQNRICKKLKKEKREPELTEL